MPTLEEVIVSKEADLISRLAKSSATLQVADEGLQDVAAKLRDMDILESLAVYLVSVARTLKEEYERNDEIIDLWSLYEEN